jgi:hypothetical protein
MPRLFIAAITIAAVKIPAPPFATFLKAACAPVIAIKARPARPIAITPRPVAIVAAAEGTLLSVIARARPVAVAAVIRAPIPSHIPALISALAAKAALGELLLGAVSGGTALAEAALAGVTLGGVTLAGVTLSGVTLIALRPVTPAARGIVFVVVAGHDGGSLSSGRTAIGAPSAVALVSQNRYPLLLKPQLVAGFLP